MANNPKLDELNSLGLQYFDNWKDYNNAIANASPGQVIGGINKRGKLTFYQAGIGEINIKQAKAELTSLKSASAPSQAPAVVVSQTVASQPSNTPVLQGTITQTQPSSSAAAAGVQQNVVIPQQVNPSTKTIDEALKSPNSKSTKKNTTLKTGKKVPSSIDRSAAIIKLVNNPEAEQEMIDIVSNKLGTRKGRSQYSRMVKSAKGTLGTPDPGPDSKQGYINAVENRKFILNQGTFHQRSLIKQRIIEQNPSISKTRLRKLTNQQMAGFSDEALFDIGESLIRDVVQKDYIDSSVFNEAHKLSLKSQEQLIKVFKGRRNVQSASGKRRVANLSNKEILDLSQKYLKLYERLEVGDSRIVDAAQKASERLREGITYGDVTYHPGYPAIEQSLEKAAKYQRAAQAGMGTATVVDDAAQVSAQITSAMSMSEDMISAAEQSVTKVINKKPISSRTIQKLMSSHTVAAGVAAGGLGLLYANKRRGENQVG